MKFLYPWSLNYHILHSVTGIGQVVCLQNLHLCSYCKISNSWVTSYKPISQTVLVSPVLPSVNSKMSERWGFRIRKAAEQKIYSFKSMVVLGFKIFSPATPGCLQVPNSLTRDRTQTHQWKRGVLIIGPPKDSQEGNFSGSVVKARGRYLTL